MERIEIGILIYFLLANALYFSLTLFSWYMLVPYQMSSRLWDPSEILTNPMAPPVSILSPAFNEEVSIVSSLRSLLHLSYPEYEIIVINDGSTDQTLAVMQKAFLLRRTAHLFHQALPTKRMRGIYQSRQYPHLWVLDKENGGKADALNAGLNFSKYPLFCTLDADSILEQDAIARVIRPYMDNFNEVVAVGGIVRIANGCRIVQGTVEEAKLGKKALPNIQVVEYLRAFLAGRVAWSQWNALLIISGAFGVFKKNPVIEMGGYSVDTVGEDMDLVIRLHQYLIDQRQKYHIVFIPDPICWTEAPSEWGVLAKQRNRWHRGLSQVLFAHIKMLFNPRYGRVGLLAMPYFFIVELLSPVIEVVGYLTFGLIAMIGTVQLEVAMAFFILAVLMGLLLSLLSILLEVLTFHRYPNVGTLIQLLFATVLENFGYRQVTSILRLQGLVDFLRKKHDWGVMTRKGF